MVAISLFSLPRSSIFSTDGGHNCVASSGGATWWTKNTPSDLVEMIQNAHAEGEQVNVVQVADNGDWFFSTNKFNSELFSTSSWDTYLFLLFREKGVQRSLEK
jgi:hypothetical protein